MRTVLEFAGERLELGSQRLTFDEVYKNLNGVVALQVAAAMPLRKKKGEKDTEFVKRIVAGYVTAAQE